MSAQNGRLWKGRANKNNNRMGHVSTEPYSTKPYSTLCCCYFIWATRRSIGQVLNLTWPYGRGLLPGAQFKGLSKRVTSGLNAGDITVYSKSQRMRPECLSGEGVCSSPSPSSKLSIGGTFRSGMFGIPIWNLGSILWSVQDEVLWFVVRIFRMVTMYEWGRKPLKCSWQLEYWGKDFRAPVYFVGSPNQAASHFKEAAIAVGNLSRWACVSLYTTSITSNCHATCPG